MLEYKSTKLGSPYSPFCREGHDKRKVGKDHRGACKLCRLLTTRKYTSTQNKKEVNKRYRLRNLDKIKMATKEWYLKAKASGKIKAYTYKKKYNLTEQDLTKLLTKQSNKCAICFEETKLVPDHDHILGHVRGMLCCRCNLVLGQFKDNPMLFKNAAGYLEKTPLREQFRNDI